MQSSLKIVDDRTRPADSDDISRIIYRAERHDQAMTCLRAEGTSAGRRPNHFSD
jgi:hypothetical protein